MTNSKITTIDAKGDQCPIPVLKLKNALSQISIGQTIMIEANDPLAAIDIPNFCHANGLELSEIDENSDFYRYKIVKTK